MADVVGDLVFETTINSGQFDAGLAKLENNAKKAANNVDKAAQKVDELKRRLAELQAVAESEKKTRKTGTVTQATGDALLKTTQQLKDAEIRLEGYQADLGKANNAVSAYVAKQQAAAESTAQCSGAQQAAAESTAQCSGAQQAAAESAAQCSGAQHAAATSTSKVSEQMGKFAKRIATIAKKVFIFTMIAKALRAMRSVLLNTINADKQMSASLAQIRGNLLTAFAPIYSFVLPAIRTLLSWLAKLTAVISSVFGAIFGQTASQAQANAKALYQQANATSAAGDAAEKAKRQLSGLDEMNRWESNDSSGGGGGGGGAAAPDFSGVSQVKLPDNVQAGLAKIGEALRSIIESLKRIWDSPVVQFIVKTVLYVAMQRIAWILSSVGLVLEGIADILDGNVWEGIKKVGLGLLDLMNPIGGLQDGFKSLWEKVASGALSAWEGIKNAFKSVPEWFQGKFRDAWQKVKDVFSTGGRIWSGIKEGIENTFRTVVNAIIRGMNTIIAVPFNKINSMLNTIRNAHFLGISPFQNMWGVNPLPVPQIPMLARGAVIPANRQFLAVLGDQRNGNNLEAPESLLRQIVREEAGSAGSRYEFIARLDRRTLFDEVITEAKLRKGQTGKNPLVAV